MKTCLAWLTTYSLIGAPMLLEACSGSKTPQTVVQQDAAAAPAQSGTVAGPEQTARGRTTSCGTDRLARCGFVACGVGRIAGAHRALSRSGIGSNAAGIGRSTTSDGWRQLAGPGSKQQFERSGVGRSLKKSWVYTGDAGTAALPTVIDLMCTQFDWTKQLGAAYQANPKVVLDSVQRLRATAVDNGALKSSSQMKVDVTQQDGAQVVQLEPTNPKVVYVPQYDPQRVFSTTTTTTNADGTSDHYHHDKQPGCACDEHQAARL